MELFIRFSAVRKSSTGELSTIGRIITYEPYEGGEYAKVLFSQAFTLKDENLSDLLPSLSSKLKDSFISLIQSASFEKEPRPSTLSRR